MPRWKRPRGGCSSACGRAGSTAREAVTLIAPTDRGMLGEFRASGYAAFLARPVRGETLLRTLAQRAARDRAAERRQGAGQAGRPRGHAPAGLSILLAEDNDINAMLARATLIKAGHRVDVVGNGKAAVDAVTAAEQRALRRRADGPAHAGHGRARRDRR